MVAHSAVSLSAAPNKRQSEAQLPPGEATTIAGLNDIIGAGAFRGIGQLRRQNGLELFRRHAGARQNPCALLCR